MSTTVIASRHHASLHLLPAAGPALDRAALRAALERHGLRLIDGSDLDQAAEFIAAEGLDPLSAAELAEDLRKVGLHARVVNRTALTGSRRVGNAMAAQAIAGVGGMALAAMAQIPVIDAIKDGASPPIWGLLVLALGALVLLVAVVNALTLQRQGGVGLRVVGASAEPTRLLTDQLSELEALLPEHLAAPLLERARRLEQHARRDPSGEAAQELRALVQELSGQADEHAAEDARALRKELAQARRALQETGGR